VGEDSLGKREALTNSSSAQKHNTILGDYISKPANKLSSTETKWSEQDTSKEIRSENKRPQEEKNNNTNILQSISSKTNKNAEDSSFFELVDSEITTEKADNENLSQPNKKFKSVKKSEIISDKDTSRRLARIQAKDSQKLNNSSALQGEGNHANNSQ
jgi:hypothetical protein